MNLLILIFLFCINLSVFCHAQLELDEFRAGNLKFTADLYKELLKVKKGNFVASPLSAEIVLALLQSGAVGPSAAELSTGLHLPANQITTHNAIKQILPELADKGDTLKLLSANRMFAANDIKIKDDYLRIAKDVFKSGVDNVDFSRVGETVHKINSWVEDQTNHKIKDLLREDQIDGLTRLVLVNALYLNAKWETPFRQTYKNKFYLTESNAVDVDMMSVDDANVKYYDSKKHQAQYLQLDYQDGNVSMVIVLPHEKTGLARMEQNIGAYFEPQEFQYEHVNIEMPTFSIESDIDMKTILTNLGIRKIFSSEEANLQNIAKENLYVSDVVQKAFINVTETGTEAAAATAAIIAIATSLQYPPITSFVADHPFMFYIKYNGLVLFFGRVK